MNGAYKLTEERQLTTPDLDGIPVDDEAEPLDADVQHLATNEDVDALAEDVEWLELDGATAPDIDDADDNGVFKTRYVETDTTDQEDDA